MRLPVFFLIATWSSTVFVSGFFQWNKRGRNGIRLGGGDFRRNRLKPTWDREDDKDNKAKSRIVENENKRESSIGVSLNERERKINVSIAVVLPHSMFKERTYRSKFLASKTAVILYLTNSETYGRHTMASQYFLQLAQYVQIPVISWNADNSGFEQIKGPKGLQLQMAPSLKHQVMAILSILDRYGWNRFSIITGTIAGHRKFEQIIRDLLSQIPEDQGEKKRVIDSLIYYGSNDLDAIARTESRIFLLYSTREEAEEIIKEAGKLGLTQKSYVWIVTQSVIAGNLNSPSMELPVGMLGIHFRTDTTTLIDQIRPAFTVVGRALERLAHDDNLNREDKVQLLQPEVSCSDDGEIRWELGTKLFEMLRHNIKKSDEEFSNDKTDNEDESLHFDDEGFLTSVELKIMNLQPSDEEGDGTKWEEIGVWQSKKIDEIAQESPALVGRLDIKDIVWPGGALKPPEGVPEKHFIRASFLEEDPYIMLSPPTACKVNKGVVCQMVDDDVLKEKGINASDEMYKPDSEYLKCCKGFCVDLLVKLAEDLSFDYKLVRVKDGNWGGVANGQWNGLVGELIRQETDLVMTSLKINSGRESVIDFSVPFLETGITILVAKRTGIISPTAFLEPFDTASWALVALVAIQIAAGCIFFFEWLSPSGYDMKTQHPQGRFSFLRTLWLVWAILFQAAVNVDCPRGYTSRFMAYTWATFALIFLAIYTANLAAFMITREEFPNLSGLEDRRLANPNSEKPPFRFGTIPNGATEYTLKNNFPNMHSYMKSFSRSTVKQGFRAVKDDRLDAFIYDATVLEYLVGQDDECNILTVGSWYAMTGYGVGFPKGSRWIPHFNEQLMKYRENGDLERMQRFWFTGACEPRKRRRTSSKPLALAQFMSAFLLLGIGISLSVVLLLCERGYFSYVRPKLTNIGKRPAQWCSLISQSVAKSLQNESEKESPKLTEETEEPLFKCQDSTCQMCIASVTKELQLARQRISLLQRQLELHQQDKESGSEEESEDEEDYDEENVEGCEMNHLNLRRRKPLGYDICCIEEYETAL